MPKPIETRIRANGVVLAVYEWPGDGVPVFFAHATGFHARCWDQVVAKLPGRRCVAIDMRGHGRSEKPEPPYDWRRFGEDVAAVARELHADGWIAVGHSKGGHAVTHAAALEPGIFRSLILLDPVIMAREQYGRPPMPEHFASRRRNHWASPEEMFERFRSRAPFMTWEPAVLKDYCDYALLPNPEGSGYVLACPPRIEAAVYAGSASADLYDEIATLDLPVRVLRARGRSEEGPMDMSGSPTFPGWRPGSPRRGRAGPAALALHPHGEHGAGGDEVRRAS
jgi:pimeloyl-ACP methyl ester carboxylesterase